MEFMKLKKLTFINKRYGRKALLHFIKYSLINKIYFYKELQCFSLTEKMFKMESINTSSTYSARKLSKNEVHLYAQNTLYEMPPSFVERAMHKQDACYAIFDNEQLATYVWCSEKPTRINSALKVHFNPEWIYIYKGFTLPQYRGKRFLATIMNKILSDYTQAGYKGLVSYVESNNFSSLQAVRQMGYQSFGSVSIKQYGTQLAISHDPSCKDFNFTVKNM